jgi:hypothetical protein
MIKSQNKRDGWQRVKQELDSAAAAGKVDNVKVRICINLTHSKPLLP